MRRLVRLAPPGLAVLLAAACGSGGASLPEAHPAPPQVATLGWHESYGKPGARLVFEVASFRVGKTGWSARVAVRNDSRVSYSLGGSRASVERTFGVMLFRTGDLRDLEQRNRANELPEVRSATRFKPALPSLLGPGMRWSGTMSAPGALADGLWLRVVFGPFVAVGAPPSGLRDPVVWITDHAHQL